MHQKFAAQQKLNLSRNSYKIKVTLLSANKLCKFRAMNHVWTVLFPKLYFGDVAHACRVHRFSCRWLPRTEISLVCIDLFASSGLWSSVNYCIFRLETFKLFVEILCNSIVREFHLRTFRLETFELSIETFDEDILRLFHFRMFRLETFQAGIGVSEEA